MQSTGVELVNIVHEYDTLKRAKDAICNRFDAIEAQAIQSIKNGVIIPEFSIRPGRGRTVWTGSPQDAIAAGDLIGVDIRKPEAPLTPLQSEKKGVPQEIFDLYTRHEPGELKLIKDDGRKAREILSQ
jgi:hypothetical protein